MRRQLQELHVDVVCARVSSAPLVDCSAQRGAPSGSATCQVHTEAVSILFYHLTLNARFIKVTHMELQGVFGGQYLRF